MTCCLWAWCACFLAATPTFAQPQDVDDPQVQAAIKRGVKYLRGAGAYGSGYDALVAYALLSTGEPAASVQPTIEATLKKITANDYKPSSHNRYEAACDLMMLEAADAEKYINEITVIAKYLIEAQHKDGYWGYNATDGADTSVSQYALLGLWAAQRAGVKVPLGVFEKAGQWHMRTQAKNGGFVYRGGQVTHTMAIAGTGSLYLIRHQLFPNAGPLQIKSTAPVEQASKVKQKKTLHERYSFLVRVDLDNPETDPKAVVVPKEKAFKSSLRLGALDEHITEGIAWTQENFTVDKPSGIGKQLYYLYGLERLSSLADLDEYDGKDWYSLGAKSLIDTQQPNGSWTAAQQTSAGTAFALLFLGKATAKLLGRPARRRFGRRAGLLGGGRGLPSSLENVEMKNGKITTKTTTAPLEAMLAELEQVTPPNLQQTQKALVDRIQLGDRDRLIGQIDRLIKLAGHPRAEVRRVAVWAIGRSNDVRLGVLLIAALADTDVGVMTEAHNALCVLAREPLGLGLAARPDVDLPADADPQTVQRAAEKWSRQATRKWRDWYRRIRPYDERNDLPPQSDR